MSQYADQLDTLREYLQRRKRPKIGSSLGAGLPVRSGMRVSLMQRLFSMFPNGWPGAALLLLRLVAGILLIHNGIVALVSGVAVQLVIIQSVGIGGGILLILGLWTPIAGALVSFVEICLMFPGTAQVQNNILLGTLGVALVALGPGVRSLDALLYGRKRVTFP